ncbi:VOC family protein [Arthrobacter gengyunqii]|uniref:VOC family protein n=1 Tax=Arthrobacter gengyunqii TaxID=2886940 RepID=A0A9X1S7W1_9MICC|nr:VOC family protein [Arthrobacter gengyunqii]MCC3267549.1 VOC family protein [Arthrobacter gengyunqii]MCC3270836.1 VOC family protein [Arthrobacter gengyunqii]UOY96472.1 VOC family protein [Arthrobacter gengyunqii]
MDRLLSHLAHLEITSPDVDASTRFYVEKFGMRLVDSIDGVSYLRCWGDYYRYSLVVRPGAEPSLANMAWRTASEEALGAAAASIEAAGVQGEWVSGGHAHGKAYQFTGPYGHPMKLFYEVENYVAEPGFESSYPDRPERRSSHAAAPRFLDHVTIAASDVRGFAEWYNRALGFRIMAFTTLDEAPITVFSVLTTNEKSHDLGVVMDTSDCAGRVNHIAFWVDTHEDLLRTADVLMENGTAMEYGPSIHGIGEQNFLYFREPSGLRVELNSGGYRNYVPDWEARSWKPSLGSNNFYRNGAMPHSMTESFPLADGFTATEEGASEEMKQALLNPYAEHGRG